MIRWVASFPKSGNTWVRLLLNAYTTGDDFDMNRVPAHYVQDTSVRWWAYASPLPLSFLASPHEFAAVRDCALLAMMKEFGNPLVKTHAANVQMDWRAVIPPYLTDFAIYIVRDPRDVAVSYSDHLGVPMDEVIELMGDDGHTMLGDDFKNMHTMTASWSRHVKTWIEDDEIDTLVMRYEDLKRDAAGELKRMVEKFGWELDETRIRKAVEATEFAKLQQREAEAGFKNRSDHQQRFFRQGKTGGWREVLTESQYRRIEADHGEMMRRFEYHPALVAA